MKNILVFKKKILGFWVVRNGGYPWTDLKLRRNSKFKISILFSRDFCLKVTRFFTTPKNTHKKNRILRKWKKLLGISPFYECVSKVTIMWCTVPEIQSRTDRIPCHYEAFLLLLSPWQPRKSNFGKNEKSTWRYHQFTYKESWC